MREFELLKHIFAFNASLPDRVTLPPGDDMALVRVGSDGVLITVDQLVDGIHFDLATTPIDKIARKAITRNLSDVAAMAARPAAAVMAASLPRTLSDQQARQLFDVARSVAQSYDCPLVGGDIAIWDHPMILSVTLLAETPPHGPITRRGAQVGDAICVTGRLGGSVETVDGYTHHLDFEPRLVLAQQLAGRADLHIHCMIDLSDGLARDLGHLCQNAGVSALLQAECLPISPAAKVASQRDGAPIWQHALGDGEDYELCFTLPADEARSLLPSQIDAVPITVVGDIRLAHDGPAILLEMTDGTSQSVDHLGWEHRSG